MPIEFRCDQCGKLLRTGDETAGKQAKCPSCGTVQPIPTPLSSAGAPAAPQGGPSAGSPFAAGSAPPIPPPPDGEVNPYQAPASALLGSDESYYAPAPGARTIRPRRIGIVEIIASTWTIATSNTNQFLMCVLVFLVCLALNYAASFAQQMILFGVQAARPPANVFVAANIVIAILGLLFQLWLNLGQTLYFVRTARGEETPFGLVFSGAPYLVTIILAAIVIGLISVGVSLICAVPGLVAYLLSKDPLTGVIVFAAVSIGPSMYIGLTFSQFQYLIIDCGYGVFESLAVCRQITSGNRARIFILYVLGGIAVFISVILCCLPSLLMIPFATLGAAVLFLKMSGQITADQLLQPSFRAPAVPASESLR